MTILRLIMDKRFKEANLGSDFCKAEILKVQKLINSSTSFTVIGIPGMGVSMFLKYLACQDFAYFIHIDINDLSLVSKDEFFKLLIIELGGKLNQVDKGNLIGICLSLIKKLAEKYPRIVLVLNRFDRLKTEFNQTFLANLRALRDVDKEKIVMIFSANLPLTEICPKALAGGNLNMYSEYFYLKPYSESDLKLLINLNSPILLKNQNLNKALKLSGGHYQLLMLLLKTEDLVNPLDDDKIKLQTQELYDHLNYSRRKTLQKITLGKKVNQPDKYLIESGYLINHSANNLTVFSPLLSSYIKSVITLKLSVKEAKLFNLLKQKLGKIITKEEIFKILWFDDEFGSDWALNALIYRLRKNPSFQTKGFIIENYKKVGYVMMKN